MVTLARRAHRMPFAPVVALLFGTVSAILVAAVPQWMFEGGVVASGLPTILAAAAPPLGLLARLLAIALAFGAGALAVWVVVAPIAAHLEAKARARTPWRDAGYDIELASIPPNLQLPRRPIFAPDELGAPLMSDEAISPASGYPDLPPVLPNTAIAGSVRAAVASSIHNDDSISDLIRRLETGLARRATSGRDPEGTRQRSSADDTITPHSDASRATAAPDDMTVVRPLGALRRLATL